MTEPFIPPPDEPVPEHDGATDKGKPGALSPNQDPTPDLDDSAIDEAVAAVELMLATAAVVDGAPTLKQVLTLAASKIKHDYGPPENINLFTLWFYGRRLKAAWCFIFLCWVFAHAGATEAAGLSLIDGKRAYVPNILGIPGAASGHAGVRAGSLIALFGNSHIEIVEKVLSGGWLQTIGGNTEVGDSDDAVSRKERRISDVSAHFNPAYASEAGADEVALVVSLGA